MTQIQDSYSKSRSKFLIGSQKVSILWTLIKEIDKQINIQQCAESLLNSNSDQGLLTLQQ